MITVLDAKLRKGYGSVDHYITGHECDDVIGLKFASLRDAKRTAYSCAMKNISHNSLKFTPIRLTVVFANGSLLEV